MLRRKMRRVAVACLFALLTGVLAPLAGPAPQDCCPMGGDMSCCPKRASSDSGCDISRCAPDDTSALALNLPKAVLDRVAVQAPRDPGRPIVTAVAGSPDSFHPDPSVPPPRA